MRGSCLQESRSHYGILVPWLLRAEPLMVTLTLVPWWYGDNTLSHCCGSNPVFTTIDNDFMTLDQGNSSIVRVNINNWSQKYLGT